MRRSAWRTRASTSRRSTAGFPFIGRCAGNAAECSRLSTGGLDAYSQSRKSFVIVKVCPSPNCGLSAVSLSWLSTVRTLRCHFSNTEKTMKKLIESVAIRLWKQTTGQDMVEYALMAGFITVAVAAAFPPVSSGINTIFSKVLSLLQQT
jgi:pilus assembly protein Flp/PilA